VVVSTPQGEIAMARHTPQPAAAVASANGAPHPEIDAARGALAQSLDQGHQLLQFFVHSQQIQCDALKGWDDALAAAAREIEHAGAWEQLLSTQNGLLRDGVSRWMNTESALLSSWFDLQARLAYQAQDQAAALTRNAWNGASSAAGSAGAARSAVVPGLAPWLEQAQAAMGAMLRPWGVDPSDQHTI
jgi:hypothetical protein